MAMSREERITRKYSHTKQERLQVKNGVPEVSQMREGVPILRSTFKGVLEYIRYNNVLWWRDFTRDGNEYIEKNLDVKGKTTLRNDLTVEKDLTVNGEIKGTRAYFDAGEAATFDAGRYLDFNNGTQMGTSSGYRMHRAGSIIGVSAQFSVTDNGSDSYATIQVRNNGSSVFSVNSSTLSGTPTYQTGMTGTQNRGIDTFVAGNILTLYANITADVTTGTLDNFCAFFEVVFDD